MRKLLIATTSSELIGTLRRRFCKNYEIADCTDGNTAIELLHRIKPDVLILDLALPQADGITVLQRGGKDVPGIVLALSALPVDYVQLTLMELGVGYIMLKPCRADAIASHIERMERFQLTDDSSSALLEKTGLHLRQLGVSTHLDGYQQLRIGIPLYAQHPEQNVFKELYADVATICGNDNIGQVEHSMRTAIKGAWSNRNDAVWADYFERANDGRIPCPSNKVFIARLAEKLA